MTVKEAMFAGFAFTDVLPVLHKRGLMMRSRITNSGFKPKNDDEEETLHMIG